LYLDALTITWKDQYPVEPCVNVDDKLCELYMLGGSGSMWGETVDISDSQSTIWPRMAAIAERLWSPKHINDVGAAENRMHTFRCILNQRGVAAAPLNNPNARSAPVGPGSCYTQ